jgi:hypothetical protein
MNLHGREQKFRSKLSFWNFSLTSVHPLIGVAVDHHHRRHRATHPTLPEKSGSALQSMRPGRLVGSDPNRTADRDYFPTPFLCGKLGI